MALSVGTTRIGSTLFSFSGTQKVSVKLKKREILEKLEWEWNSNPGANKWLSSSIKVNHAPIGGPKILSLAIRKRWLGAPGFGLFLDNYKILSERMNVLKVFIFPPWRKETSGTRTSNVQWKFRESQPGTGISCFLYGVDSSKFVPKVYYLSMWEVDWR